MATNTWSTGPVFTPQRADFGLAAAGSRLFAIGGAINGGGSPSLRRRRHRPELLELATAVSRKKHGTAGEFNIPLPLTGQPGVECREEGDGDRFVFTFNSEVTSGAAALTTGTGTAGTPTFLGRTMTVPLTGVTDIQKLTLTLSGVMNSVGQVLPSTALKADILTGDAVANRTVNTSDIGQTKANSGRAASEATFRTDLNVNGTTNTSDISIVKSASGHTIQP